MDMTMRNFGYMVDTSIHHHVLAKTAFMPLMVMSLLPAASGRRFVTGVDSDSGIDLDNKPHSVLPEVSPGHNARLEAFNITPPVSDAVTPSSLNASSSMAHLHLHAQSEMEAGAGNQKTGCTPPAAGSTDDAAIKLACETCCEPSPKEAHQTEAIVWVKHKGVEYICGLWDEFKFGSGPKWNGCNGNNCREKCGNVDRPGEDTEANEEEEPPEEAPPKLGCCGGKTVDSCGDVRNDCRLSHQLTSYRGNTASKCTSTDRGCEAGWDVCMERNRDDRDLCAQRLCAAKGTPGMDGGTEVSACPE